MAMCTGAVTEVDVVVVAGSVVVVVGKVVLVVVVVGKVVLVVVVGKVVLVVVVTGGSKIFKFQTSSNCAIRVFLMTALNE